MYVLGLRKLRVVIKIVKLFALDCAIWYNINVKNQLYRSWKWANSTIGMLCLSLIVLIIIAKGGNLWIKSRLANLLRSAEKRSS